MKKVALLIFLLTSLLTGGISVFSQTNISSTVVTNNPSQISYNYAVFNGQVYSNGVPTSYYFEYGQTTSLGQFTSSQVLNSVYNSGDVTAVISGLYPNTTYYYRLTAVNSYGQFQGSVISFTTLGYGNNNNNNITNQLMIFVVTNAATNNYGTFITLNAYTSTNIYPSSAWFEYGTDQSNMSQKTATITINASSYYSQNQSFSSQAIGLIPNTNYYFRAVVQNNGNIYYGEILNFITGNSLAYVYPSYTSPTYTPTPTYNTTYTPTPTYQYVYQQPKVVYVNPDGTPYTGQQSQSYSNVSLASQQGNQYYAPYYGMQTIIPPSQNSGLSANIIGAAGSFSGSSLFGAVLFIMLIGLLITGILKEAF